LLFLSRFNFLNVFYRFGDSSEDDVQEYDDVIDYDAETASSAAGGGGGGGGGFCERYAGQACSQFIGNRSVFMRSRLEQRLVEEQLTGALYAMHFACPATTLLKDEESTRDNHVLACNICQIFADLKKLLADSAIHLS